MELKPGYLCPPGYKQTEVGVIPEDWDIKPLGNVVDFLDGKRRPVKDSDRAKMRGDIPYYGASGIVDYVNDFLFDEDLILLGEDGENILSRNCRLAFKISGKTWVNNHAHVLRPKQAMLLDYLNEFLESRDYAQYNTGTAQPKLNKLVCSGIPVLCPPLPQQRAIAGALSDVDALIGALDQLIAKKRGLKQAAMQQLLTGRKRLPGFHGEWEVKPIGSFSAFITKGSTPTTYGFNWEDGGVLFLRNECVSGNGLDLTQSMFISEAAHAALIRGEVRSGDILITITGNVGRVVHLKPDFGFANINQHIARIRVKDPGISPYFVCHWLSQPIVRAYYLSITTGQAYPQISLKQVRETQVPLPPLPEQTAIAEVMSDMDAELEALKQRRDKTNALKQGMMQELLTGRTRLV